MAESSASAVSWQTIWDAVLSLKQDMLKHLDSKLDPINSSLTAIHTSLQTLSDHVNEPEHRVSSIEDNVQDHWNRQDQLGKENSHLLDKVEDLENRSRSCNLRIIRVPESAEGRDITGFTSKLVPQLLGSENFPEPLVIERAQRSPTTRLDDKPPRPILIKLLNFHYKVEILRLARKKNELVYNGSRVHIHPDFSPESLKKRRGFDTVKKKLRELDLKFSLRHPSTLSVMADGKQRLFRCPKEAEAALMSPVPAESSVNSP